MLRDELRARAWNGRRVAIPYRRDIYLTVVCGSFKKMVMFQRKWLGVLSTQLS